LRNADCGKLSGVTNLRKIKCRTFHKLPLIAFSHSADEKFSISADRRKTTVRLDCTTDVQLMHRSVRCPVVPSFCIHCSKFATEQGSFLANRPFYHSKHLTSFSASLYTLVGRLRIGCLSFQAAYHKTTPCTPRQSTFFSLSIKADFTPVFSRPRFSSSDFRSITRKSAIFFPAPTSAILSDT